MLEEYKSYNAERRGSSRYVTLAELRAKLGNRSRSAVYGDLAAGRLPKPIKLGGKLYWAEDAVDAHLKTLAEKAA